MLLMLASPTFLFLIAHLLFPARGSSVSLETYYFERARMIRILAAFTVVLGTLFRPLAFGMPLWVADNASGLPTFAICVLLTAVQRPKLHHVLVPLILLFVLLDTLTASYSIA